jgi:hypothetical protein
MPSHTAALPQPATPPPPPQLEPPMLRKRLRALMYAAAPLDLSKKLLHECLMRDLHAPTLAMLHTEAALEWHMNRQPSLIGCRRDDDENIDLYYLTHDGLNKARAESRP